MKSEIDILRSDSHGKRDGAGHVIVETEVRWMESLILSFAKRELEDDRKSSRVDRNRCVVGMDAGRRNGRAAWSV